MGVMGRKHSGREKVDVEMGVETKVEAGWQQGVYRAIQ